jgi:hypothetical protein
VAGWSGILSNGTTEENTLMETMTPHLIGATTAELARSLRVPRVLDADPVRLKRLLHAAADRLDILESLLRTSDAALSVAVAEVNAANVAAASEGRAARNSRRS